MIATYLETQKNNRALKALCEMQDAYNKCSGAKVLYTPKAMGLVLVAVLVIVVAGEMREWGQSAKVKEAD